jgi:hypothetical protein
MIKHFYNEINLLDLELILLQFPKNRSGELKHEAEYINQRLTTHLEK